MISRELPHAVCPGGTTLDPTQIPAVACTLTTESLATQAFGIDISQVPEQSNGALLSPGHATWFDGVAGAVLVLGLLGIWAASAHKPGQAGPY